MKREKLLLKNTTILTIGRFVPQIFSIITLPIITGHLSTAEYGVFDLMLTLVSLLLPITTLQIQSAAFRFLIDSRNNEKKIKEIISNILVFTIVTSSISLAVLFALLHSYSSVIRFTICLFFLADILNLTIGQIARGLGRNILYAFSSVVLSITNASAILVLVLWRDMGLEGALLGSAISNVVAVVFLAGSLSIYHYLDKSLLSWRSLKRMLNYSWPMVPNNLSTWVLNISDRLVITYFLGVEANAIYAVAYKIPSILNIAKSTFVMAWQENAAIAVKDSDASEYYSYMFDTIYSIIMGITALLIASTPVLFTVLIKGNYEESYNQMPILFMGIFFNCISAFQGGIYVAHMKVKSSSFTTVIAALLNLIIDFALVNRIGIAAGSWSTLISYFLLFVFRLFDVKRIQTIRYNYAKMIMELLFVACMCFICFYNTLATNILNAVLGVIFSFIINIKIVKKLGKILIERGNG